MVSQLARELHVNKPVLCVNGPNLYGGAGPLRDRLPESCVATIMESFVACQHAPNLPAELLKYLAKTHGCWHVSIDLLERRLVPYHHHLPLTELPQPDPTSPMAALGMKGIKARGGSFKKTKKVSRGRGGMRQKTGVTRTEPEEDLRDGDEVHKDFLGLIALYGLIGANDVLAGSWCTRVGVATETKLALISEQCGRWSQAQLAYYRIMHKSRPGKEISADKGAKQRARPCDMDLEGASLGEVGVSQAERTLWEEHWVSCAKQLNYWDVLTEFSRNTQHTDLSLECAWKIPSWAELKDIFSRTTMDLTPQRQLYHSYVMVIENKLTNAEESGREGVQTVLRKWVSLPTVDGHAHTDLLRVLQQYTELHESCEMLTEVQASQNRGSQLPGIRHTFRCWRERQPNVWEGIAVWNDVLTWRNHMFAHINNHLQPYLKQDQNLGHLGFKEMAWTVVRFAHVARKHKLYEVCLNSLNKLFAFQTGTTIEPEDAYVKAVEQCKCQIEKHTADEVRLCLSNMSKLDTAPFSKEQVADFLQLRGRLTNLLPNCGRQANDLFKQAVDFSDQQPKAWEAWGEFCLSLWEVKRKGNSNHAEDAMVCLMQAIKLNSTRSHHLVAIVLWLLSDPSLAPQVGPLFSRGTMQVHLWVWLDWIPELLDSLERAEGEFTKQALVNLVLVHPHSALPALRAHLYHAGSPLIQDVAIQSVANRSADTMSIPPRASVAPGSTGVDSSATSSIASSPATPSTRVAPSPAAPPRHSDGRAYTLVEEVWQRLKDRHARLLLWTDRTYKALVELARLTPVEVCLDEIRSVLPSALEHHGTLPDAVRTAFAGAVATMVEAVTDWRDQQATGPKCRWAEQQELALKCAEAMQTVDATQAKDVVQLMLHWQTVLDAVLSTYPRSVPLEPASCLGDPQHDLVAFHLPHELVPAFPHAAASYLPYSNSHTDHNLTLPGAWAQVKWLRVAGDVSVGQRFGSCGRGVHILCTDGVMRSLWVRHRPGADTLSHQRVAKFARIVQYQLSRHITSQATGLSVRVPSPLCLDLDTEASWYEAAYPSRTATSTSCADAPIEAGACPEVSYDQMLAWHLADISVGSAEPIALVWHQLDKAERDVSPDDQQQRKLQAMSDVTNYVVPNTIMSRYISHHISQLDLVFGLRRRVALRFAALCLLAHGLGVRTHRLDEISLSLATGYVYLSSPLPELREDGSAIVARSGVPLQIAQNLVAFLRPFGFAGPFINSLSVAAEAMVEGQSHLTAVLRCILRGEIMSRSVAVQVGSEETRSRPQSPEEFVTITAAAEKCATSVMSRFSTFVVEDAVSVDDPLKGRAKPVNAQVLKLIDVSLNPVNRIRMPLSEQPWF
eukprot:c18306_g1_i1.p1 GENE.c18306_g1_i1~~c18306_g1_i1.p1  ORF type:complete len:1352 (-),score=236.81 c18306_g1_i1:122-4177(-)